MNIFHLFIAVVFSSHSVLSPCFAQDNIDLNQLALPNEVKDLGKSSGSIFYSPSQKGKPLIPVHIWGEVGKSGLHYVPMDTGLVNSLSIAGGPREGADLREVTLTRKQNGEYLEREFDLSNGGNLEAHQYTLNPGDTIFVAKNYFRDDRAYYTTLASITATVVVSILTAILLYRDVEDDRRTTP